jgi:hypothetical protein
MHRFMAIGVGVPLVAAAPHPAAAQMWTPQEVYGGYVYLRDSENHIGLPVGWTAGGSLRVTDWLSVVGEGSVSTRTTGGVRIEHPRERRHGPRRCQGLGPTRWSRHGIRSIARGRGPG